MYCEQCGKKINDEAKFCKYCGSPTDIAAEAKQEEQPAAEIRQEVPAFAEEAKKEKKFSLPKREKKEKKEKPAKVGKRNLKKTLLGVLALFVAVVAVRAGVEHYFSNRVVAQIPDPELYFGVAADEKLESGDKMWIVFRTEEDLRAKADSYMELLQSNYPFELGFASENDEHYFDYSGDDFIWDKQMDQIEVSYRDKGENGKYWTFVKIYNCNNFELVDVGQDESAAIAEQEEPPAISVEEEEPVPTVVVEDEPEEEVFFETCKTCFGNGKCSWCNGSGHKTKFQAGIGYVDQTCTGCFGDGDCSSCGGSGMKRDT